MKIRIKVSTGYVGSDSEDYIEIDECELEGMSEKEKDDYINEQAFEYMIMNMIDWTWWEEDKE